MPDVSSNLATLGAAGWVTSAWAVGAAVQPPRALWADRARYQSLNNVVTFTDFGGGTAQTGGGVDLKWNGSQWKLQNNIAVIDRLDTANQFGPGAGPFNMNPNAATIKAGQLALYSCIDFVIALSKSASVETATFQLRIGTAFSVADALIAQFTLTLTEVSGLFPFRIRRTLIDTFQRETNGNAQDSFGGASSSAYPAAVALTAGNFDANDVRISLWLAMSGAAETCTLQGYRAMMESTDSL